MYSFSQSFEQSSIPEIHSNFEGSGNDIKTHLVNLNEIAKALKREPLYILKFLSFELKTPIIVNAIEDKWILYGFQEDECIKSGMDHFIKTYVTCSFCSSINTYLVC